MTKQNIHVTGKISFSRCKQYGLVNTERKRKWGWKHGATFHRKSWKEVKAHAIGIMEKYPNYDIAHSKFIELYGIRNEWIFNDYAVESELFDSKPRGKGRRYHYQDKFIIQDDKSLVFSPKQAFPVLFTSPDYQIGYTMSNGIYENDSKTQRERLKSYINKRRKVKIDFDENLVITREQYMTKCKRVVDSNMDIKKLEDYEEFVVENVSKGTWKDRKTTQYSIIDTRWKQVAMSGFSFQYPSPKCYEYQMLKSIRLKEFNRKLKQDKKIAKEISIGKSIELFSYKKTEEEIEKERMHDEIRRDANLRLPKPMTDREKLLYRIEKANENPSWYKLFRKKSKKRIWRKNNPVYKENYDLLCD